MPSRHLNSNSQLAVSQAWSASLALAHPTAAVGAHDGSSSALLPLPLSLVELRTEGVERANSPPAMASGEVQRLSRRLPRRVPRPLRKVLRRLPRRLLSPKLQRRGIPKDAMVVGELGDCEGEVASGLQSRRRQEQGPAAHWELALGPKELQERTKTEEIRMGELIAHLTSLQTLRLRDKQVTGDFNKTRALTNLQTLDLFKTQVAGDFDGLRPERPARRACRTPESRCAQPAGLPAGSPAPLLGFSSCLSLAQVPGRLRAKRAR